MSVYANNYSKNKKINMEKNLEKDLNLLSLAFYEALEFLDPYNVGSPMLDCKRPFGNSGYEGDILEIIGQKPEDEEDGDKVYSKKQYDYARELYTVHLTPHLKKHGIAQFRSLTR
jgi:hypothetical protein